MAGVERRESAHARFDLVGWLCLAVLSILTFWVVTPVVLLFCLARSWWLLRAGRDVRYPTAAALLLGLISSALWLWYFSSVASGRVP